MNLNTSMDEMAEKFLAEISVPSTRASYRVGCRSFIGFIGSRTFLECLNDHILVEYWEWLKMCAPTSPNHRDSKELAGKTISLYISVVKQFLGYLSAEDMLPAGFSLRRAKRALQRQYTAYELNSDSAHRLDPRLWLIVHHYDHIDLPPVTEARQRLRRIVILRNRAIMHTLYSTAGMLSEVAQLSRLDVIDGMSELVSIPRSDKSPVILFLDEEARAAIRAYLQEREDDHEALFVGYGKQGKLGSRSIWRIVKDAGKANGLANVSPRDLRYLRVVELVRAGKSLGYLQELLGNLSSRTVYKHYGSPKSNLSHEDYMAYRLTVKEAVAKARAAEMPTQANTSTIENITPEDYPINRSPDDTM